MKEPLAITKEALQLLFDEWLRDHGGGEYWEAPPDEAFFAGYPASELRSWNPRVILGVAQSESDTDTH